MILMIDNYDSFTYNLYQYVSEMTDEAIHVIRNDVKTTDEILAMDHTRLIISPGPGRPENAGVCVELAGREKKRPILGVCLGHQAICKAFGIGVIHAKELKHGKRSYINIEKRSELFKGLGSRIEVGRYHSLAADRNGDFKELVITSRSDDGEIMSVEHTEYKIFGIQFHPESILTADGKKILKNFLEV